MLAPTPAVTIGAMLAVACTAAVHCTVTGVTVLAPVPVAELMHGHHGPEENNPEPVLLQELCHRVLLFYADQRDIWKTSIPGPTLETGPGT